MKIHNHCDSYAKNRTLENADRLYQAVYGLLPASTNNHERRK